MEKQTMIEMLERQNVSLDSLVNSTMHSHSQMMKGVIKEQIEYLMQFYGKDLNTVIEEIINSSQS